MARLAEGDAWQTALGSPVTEKTVAEVTRPLTDAGWKHTVRERWIRWQTAQGDAGVQFDTFAAQNPSTLPTWTFWAGPDIDRPTWTIHASPSTPAPLLAHLTENLAHGTGTRQTDGRKATGIKQTATTHRPRPLHKLPTAPRR
ncbi:DUF317 domain-containing protein [Streptomyces sp. NPDC052701]|uniref:DUF317 domain-containing protein n=1 Tax=Streptomyces sp. NPDC052701 TaxID=3155533 RepID=UPI00342C7A9A